MKTAIKNLEKQITNYSEKYYKGSPEISDQKFDTLIDELRELSPESTVLSSIGWGIDIESFSGQKVDHKFRVTGLDKTRDLNVFKSNIKNFKDILISAKLDGISCVAEYENGKLIRALTRGDGYKGIDITDKFKIISGEFLRDNWFSGLVRGELVIHNDVWTSSIENNDEIENKKNPRNFVAGLINRNSIDENLNYISFIPYTISNRSKDYVSILDVYDVRRVLVELFGEAVQYYKYSREYTENMNESDLKELYRIFSNSYPVDGLVITNQQFIFEQSGEITYDQFAFKFESERQFTTVRNIEWNLNRTSKLTPVLIVDPVELSGATVTRCTAYNAKYILDNKITKGSLVELERSGEVIPKIISVDNSNVQDPEYVEYLPEICPVCNRHLEISGADLKCINEDCEDKVRADLEVWINILGKVDNLGNKLKFKFMDEVGYNSISDIYTKPFPDEDYYKDSIQRQSFMNMLNKLSFDDISIEKALQALNIPRLGETASKKIANDVELFNDLRASTLEDDISPSVVYRLSKIVGNATTESILNNLNKLKNLKFIELNINKYLENNRSSIKQEDHEETEVVYRAVAVTGKLELCTRKQFQEILNNKDWDIVDNIKKSEYLVTNNPNSGSSKNKKAQELGIEIITEKDFLDMIGGI